MSEIQHSALDDRRAAYAAWRERLRSTPAVDLTKADEPASPSSEWSSDALFAPAPDEDVPVET